MRNANRQLCHGGRNVETTNWFLSAKQQFRDVCKENGVNTKTGAKKLTTTRNDVTGVHCLHTILRGRQAFFQFETVNAQIRPVAVGGQQLANATARVTF